MKKLIIILLISLSITGCWKNKEGQKVGVIVKVAKEGPIWGTYEGELIRGGLQDASGSNGQAFHFGFGAWKSELVEKAIQVMDKNKPVTISYECEVFVAPWRSNHHCFVTGIQDHE